jgi:uncharacterized protein (DUF4415 family)
VTKENDIKSYSLDEIRRMKGRTDWNKLSQAGDHSGPAEFEIDWSKAEIVEPATKQAISLRLDPEVLAFFKAQGKGYQTRINAVLRSYMLTQLKSHG